MIRKFSRRDFLRLGMAGAAALLLSDLAACRPDDPKFITTPYKIPLTPIPTEATIATQCKLTPVVMPTRPATVPGYTEQDPVTGLHMTGTPVDIDLASYRLRVTGKVDRPLALSFDDLRCMPKVTSKVDIICKGYFEDFSTWAGVPVAHVLSQAGVQPGATAIIMNGGDKYSSQASLEVASAEDAFLAYEWVDGQPVPVLFGFPLRAVFPSQPGYHDVKWLLELKVV
jgi:DMSO/TMAO reductase YedYZ molybdopterin-dependent catalytic subunit